MPKTVAYKAEIPHYQLLDENGKLDTNLARGTLKDEDVVFLYEQMSISRHYDEIAFKLQRSGRMGTYPQNKGQEAVAGAGLAIKHHAPESWLVPCRRENLGAVPQRVAHGEDLAALDGDGAAGIDLCWREYSADLDSDRHAPVARGGAGLGREVPQAAARGDYVLWRWRRARAMCTRR
ncbi:MAG: hypothetical protein R3B46_05080 [Phycisphaerales bacterium]